MRIVAQSSLQAFWQRRPETEAGLRLWLDVARKAEWESMNDVQQRWSKAKVLNGERIRFEVAGGDYRMICAIQFKAQIIGVKFLGTHAQYDRIEGTHRGPVLKGEKMELRPIHSEAELKAAKAEMARLWNAESDEDVQRLADWAELVDVFEARLLKPARGVDPVAVIHAEMEMNGRSRADLAAVVGQSRATEILNRKRPLTLPMIRAIHKAWDIPADMLVDEYETA